jgi:hypothetical protein
MWIAAVALLLALVCARLARCGVRVSAHGVRVTNIFKTTDLEWGEIREFKVSLAGPSQIALKGGRWVGITGIEQTNWAWLTNRHDTPERSMSKSSTGSCKNTSRTRLGKATATAARPQWTIDGGSTSARSARPHGSCRSTWGAETATPRRAGEHSPKHGCRVLQRLRVRALRLARKPDDERFAKSRSRPTGRIWACVLALRPLSGVRRLLGRRLAVR